MTAPVASSPTSPPQQARTRVREWGVLPVLGVALPKFLSSMAPHVSIDPVVAGLCALTFVRSQSGTKLRLLSVQLRNTLFARRLTGASWSP